MGETKPPESAYSSEQTEITGAHSLRGATATAEAEKSEKAAVASESTQSERATEATPKLPAAAAPLNPSALNPLAGNTRAGEYSLLADFLGFLRRTRREWLSVGAASFGPLAEIALANHLSELAKTAREKRHEEAVATVTPDRLIARCGTPAEDATKEVFPVLMRTISYERRGNQRVVFTFSRTAEEKSDWVFLSMKDGSGTKSYETPEEKIAALSCLDSKK